MHDVQPTNTRYTAPKEKKKKGVRQSEERSDKESIKKKEW